MNNLVKISFTAIICTLNRPSDLRQNLISLINQTYSFDHIVIVDSSDDNSSFEQYKKVTSEQSNCFYQKSAKGLTFQRNVGISFCKNFNSDYLCFFDDDVILEQDYLETAVNNLKSFSSESVSFCGNARNEVKIKRFEKFIRKFFLICDYSSGRKLISGDAGHIY